MDDDAEALKRYRTGTAVLLSLAVHVLVVAAIFFSKPAAPTNPSRRGEPIMIELANAEGEAPKGNPASRNPAPPGPGDLPSPPQVIAKPAPPTRTAPRAVERPVPAPPRPSAPTSPTEEQRVAAAPPSAADPAPAPAETIPKPSPAPEASPAPAEPSPAPSPPAPPVATPTPPSAPAPSASEVAAARPGAPTAEARSTPAPEGRPALPDIRSALRRGGGGEGTPGGRGGGRGGIEGEPIPLDSADTKYNDYLDRIRRMIKAKWIYPCLKDDRTRECEYKSAQLTVQFGILKNGRLQFVEVVEHSAWPVYDDYAVNAIKLAAPFPDVPPSMMLSMNSTSTGVSIVARFVYLVDTSLTNILR